MKCPRDFIAKCPQCKSTAYIVPAEWYTNDRPEDFDPELIRIFEKVYEHKHYHGEDDYIYCPKCKTVWRKNYWHSWREMCEVFI